MVDEIEIEGTKYISSKRAAEITGYAQDYVGQLARGGYIDARRIGGLWHVSLESLQSYSKNAEIAKKQQIITPHQVAEVDSLVSFDGKDYISASRAAQLTGYHQDYVGQLARSGTIISRQVGNRWYVDREAILAHKKEKDHLLGALQSESVGIDRTISQSSTNMQVSAHEDMESYFRYTQDTSGLLPATRTRPDYGGGVANAHADTHGGRMIHARDLEGPHKRFQYLPNDNRDGKSSPHISRKPMFYKIILVILAVLFLASTLVFYEIYIGTYTNGTNESPISKNLTNTIDIVGLFFENLFVSELVYIRI